MSDEAGREDACREYQSSLEDLTFNSKPHINMLTILAEENLHFAKDIVAIIEAQIAKAPPAEKLPVLYLVDSIVKNVGGEYLDIFAKNLVSSFILVFEKVDENTRKSLFKLRSTWDDIFPLKKLYALDVRVNSVDPAWPVKPLPPNVNASIHVNPRFIKPTEEVSVQRGNISQPPNQPVLAEKSLTQEQAIRQQLLAKQKQLLELQQKKIELELEQTKAQLAANQLAATASHPVNATSQSSVVPKVAPVPNVQTTQCGKSWHILQQEGRISARDPRLNRVGPTSHVKEQVPNKESAGVINQMDKKNTLTEKQKFERIRIPRKDLSGEKPKSPSPSSKSVQGKNRSPELEKDKVAEVNRDPRLRKPLDKTDMKEDDVKKKRFEKKDRDESLKASDYRTAGARTKLNNGFLNKHDRSEVEKPDSKSGKQIARKRSRSRSPLLHSPKRKERRSPKRRARSASLSPQNFNKRRQVGSKHLQSDFSQSPHMREAKIAPKKNSGEPRRPKRSQEDRVNEQGDTHEQRLPSELKENVAKRWRSGWEENKHPKQPVENLGHGKSGSQRRRSPWSGNQRGPALRIPKTHRLTVDANLQIPEVLHSASKRDLLKKASKRREEGEISEDVFLNVAHQINQLFQYQEEKQRFDSWDRSSDEGTCRPQKKALLSTPVPQTGNMSDAEISYYEHKAKLRRTQVQHLGGKEIAFSKHAHHLQHNYLEDASELSSQYEDIPETLTNECSARAQGSRNKENISRSPPHTGLPLRNSPSPVTFKGPSGKSVPGFDCSSNLDIDQVHVQELSPSGKFDSSNSEHSKSGSNGESPLIQEDSSVHNDSLQQGSTGQTCELIGKSPDQVSSQILENPHAKALMSQYDGPQNARFEGSSGQIPVQHRFDGPTRIQHGRFEHSTPARFDGPTGSHDPSRFDAHHQQDLRFEGPHVLGRYDGPLNKAPERFEGTGRNDPSMFPGPPRFDGPHIQRGVRFDSPASRFDGEVPMGYGGSQMQPSRFDGTMRSNSPHMQQAPGRFEAPVRFGDPQGQQEPLSYDGSPCAQNRLRYNSPVSVGMEHNQGHVGAMRSDGLQQDMSRFDSAPGQQGMRFCRPNQAQVRQPGPFMFRGSQDQNPLTSSGGHLPSNYGMPGNRFADSTNVFDAQQAFQGQQSLSQGHNVHRVSGSSGFAGSFVRNNSPFYSGDPVSSAGNMNATVPGGGRSQAVNILPGIGKPQLAAPFHHGQPFVPLHENPVAFTQSGPQFSSESHLGQVDVNDLLSKLISTGIIKPVQSDGAVNADTARSSQTPPVPDEEDEEEDDDQIIPDLTGFSIEAMKQRYNNVVTKLYTGIQCYSCGMRFTASQTDVYADHLDWHYRQNRSEKDISKKVTHRRWYYTLMDWIEFEEIADLEERAKSQFFEKVQEEVVQKTQEAAKENEFQSVKATLDVVGESCEICQEQFEMYWEEEEEEWHLKNAIRVDGQTYHPSCYEDYKNTSSFVDCSPSPSKAVLENPLNAFIKEEKEVESSCPSIKQEPEVQSSCSENPQIKLETE